MESVFNYNQFVFIVAFLLFKKQICAFLAFEASQSRPILPKRQVNFNHRWVFTNVMVGLYPNAEQSFWFASSCRFKIFSQTGQLFLRI